MNNNFKLSNATAMEYTIANIAGLSNAMRMQTPCIDLANSLGFANIAPLMFNLFLIVHNICHILSKLF